MTDEIDLTYTNIIGSLRTVDMQINGCDHLQIEQPITMLLARLVLCSSSLSGKR